MLSRSQVTAFAVQRGFADRAARLAETVEPGWSLEPSSDLNAAAPAVTKIGGGADLADNEQWPRNARGIALTLLAQINCSALPEWTQEWSRPTLWPHEGRLLRIFADLVDNPVGAGHALVLDCSCETPVRRHAAPPLPDPWPRGGPYDIGLPEDRYPQLPDAPVVARPYVGPPSFIPANLGPLPGSDEIYRYDDWVNLASRDGAPDDVPAVVHSLLGPAISTNIDDVRGTFASGNGGSLTPENWVPLLHIGHDEQLGLDLAFGAFTVLLPRADLARADYRRAMCVAQS